MKTKFDIAITIILCSIPAFAAGWKWHAGLTTDTREPVNQVIQAIQAIQASDNLPDSDPPLQTAAIFDSLHNRTVTSFVGTFQSFGRARIVKVEEMRHTDLWTLHPGRRDGFQVALIGLDRETPVRFEVAQQDGVADSTPANEETEVAHPSQIGAGMLSLPAGDSQELDPIDIAGVEKLSAGTGAKRAIFSEHDSVVAYGPIRASASCLICHDGDSDQLLGVFRYTFPLPVQPLNLRLAGNP